MTITLAKTYHELLARSSSQSFIGKETVNSQKTNDKLIIVVMEPTDLKPNIRTTIYRKGIWSDNLTLTATDLSVVTTDA